MPETSSPAAAPNPEGKVSRWGRFIRKWAPWVLRLVELIRKHPAGGDKAP